MTEIQEVSAVLSEMFGVFVDVDIPTGRKTNLAEDLKLTQAPPEKLKISLGQKPTFDPSLVKELNTLRSQAHRACGKLGIRFMGGYAIPNANKEAVLAELEGVKKDFEASAAEFFRKYPDEVQKWAENAGEYADAFRGAADSIDVIKAKTKFRVYTYPLGEAQMHSVDESTPNTLVSQLFNEISVDATALWRDSFHSKGVNGSAPKLRTEATLAIVRPFDRIRIKLDGLSFIDPSINRVVARIDDVLQSVRLAGSPVQGASLAALQGLCFLLKDEQMIREFAEGADDSAQDLFLAAVPPALDDQSQTQPGIPMQLPIAVNGPVVVTTPTPPSVTAVSSTPVVVPVSASAPTPAVVPDFNW